MTAIATVSGRVIDYLNPDPAQISLDDLHLALGREPRYAGQTCRPYSVAQHSLLVAHLVPRAHRLHALLHDAAEAFTRDVPSPMKEAMRGLARLTGHQSPYDVIEHGIWKAICRRFDLSPEMPEAVTAADALAMVIEAPVLQPKGWKHAVWDFARAAELEIGGVHREQFFRICALQHGGGIDWLWAVIDELTERRKAEA